MSLRKSLMLFTVLLVLSTLLIADEMGRTITVNPEGDINSLQKAIDIAQNGDIIKVMPGVYNTKAVINKSLEIVGEKGKVYFEPVDSEIPMIVVIGSDELKFEGIKFRGDGRLFQIIMSNVSFRNCKFETSGTAILFSGGSLSISTSVFNGVREKIQGGFTYRGTALLVSAANNIEFTNNLVKHMGTGLLVSNVDTLYSQNNEFSENVIGAKFIDVLELGLSENIFYRNHVAVILSGKGNCFLESNIFSKSTKWDLSLSTEECRLCSKCVEKPFDGSISGRENISDSYGFCPEDSIEILKLFARKD
ncbi:MULTISPECIES: hypothetical protein [Kosmotoga]|uniref:Periplasmic copper-binding protein NosD beta helix domain-containing protein n=1 Tax=Kosmotoga olearia (strain ATCC BAA-1733 / DSM 21960 / TBF 19.5.1) TaxID=521045 RepID=C5CHK4_KOSOT|nr:MULTISPECIES: hypothetical protein [Kosmotoga]ACR79759.1 hypothetical protein Kole_1056 [Kosmotoga olearia TBF 19.5.1]OAA21634.1 hypothetical protein DU53_05690 [Kosmotoga sp. DU53]